MKASQWRIAAGLLLLLSAVVGMGQGAYIQIKAHAAQVLLQRAWQATLQDGGRHRPWPWADHWPVAEISFLDAGKRYVVLEGESGHSLAFAPGHNPASGMPGEDRTTVISGHRDTHFRILESLAPGETVVLKTAKATSIYRVSNTRVADSSTESLVLQAREELKLVTCWPFDALAPSGPLRYVVTLSPANSLPEAGSSS